MSEVHTSDAVNRRLPQGEAVAQNVAKRRTTGNIGRLLFLSSTVIAMLALVLLLYNVIDEAFGLVAVQNKVDPATLFAGRPLDEVSKEELVALLQKSVSKGVFARLEREEPFADRPVEGVRTLVRERVVQEEIVSSWGLTESLFQRSEIEAQAAEEFPDAKLQFRSWVNRDFLLNPMASEPAFAGVRTALLGSLWMIAITILLAFPIGVGAAIYLEEYGNLKPFAGPGRWREVLNNILTRFNSLVQTNINNLAGVPSIIYGMLGLAIFTRGLGQYTSGAVFGVPGADPNAARTVLSASLTMALLILPLIIINAREAIRAVPNSLRQASMAVGATKLQTIWHHVLPLAFPGILTGTILGMSRAIGETAPLIVVGASTFIVSDPDGIFSKFTALPIQIYNWTSRPQPQFRDIAAAAIIVLLVVLLTLNSAAVLLRNRFRRSF